MSYNISRWKTKKVRDLSVPFDAFYNISDSLRQRGWCPSQAQITAIDVTGVHISIELSKGGRILGRLATDRTILVNELELRGEGSGTVYEEILKPALELSTGKLEAILIWEGGDSITRLLVEDGQIMEEQVEL